MKKLANTSLPYLQSLVTRGVVRSQEITLAIGHAIAYGVGRPLEDRNQLGLPGAYFVGTYGELMEEYLEALNRVVPIDYKAVRESAIRFYKQRELMLNGHNTGVQISSNAIYDMIGLTTTFSGDEIALMTQTKGLFNTNVPFFRNSFHSFIEDNRPSGT